MSAPDLHPAPSDTQVIFGREHWTAESTGRDQYIKREEESALGVADIDLDLTVQDLRRLLVGDRDPELIERLTDELAHRLDRLYGKRDFG